MQISKRAEYLISRLDAAGERGYIVGGCVRDLVMGLQPHDWDITTSATPQKIIEIFSDLKTVPTGIKHGTITVICEDEAFEITTFRNDGEYTDHRRPSSVQFVSSLTDDLARRDFTVNAIAYSPREGIIDKFGGVEDIKAKMLRAVGNAETRFEEDALRILRALRFAAKLNFEIEEKTFLAAQSASKTLMFIAKERITDEFFKLIVAPYAECVLMRSKSILDAYFEDIAPDGIDLMPADLLTRIAYIFRRARNNVEKLCMPRGFAWRMTRILDYKFKNVKTLIRDLEEDAPRYLAINDMQGELSEYNTLIKGNACCTVKQLAISGGDLYRLGFRGAKISEILEMLLDEVISGEIENEMEKLKLRAGKEI